MARTPDQILASYQDAVAVSDPSADGAKGPLFSLVGTPLSEVLPPTEQGVDTLSQIYSAEFAQSATSDQAQAFLTNWGEAAGLGHPSATTVYFMAFGRPNSSTVIPIPVGSIISNQDQTLQYITTAASQINGQFADTYFNPTRRTYEVGLPVIAVENGPAYDLKAGLINTKVSQLPGIDAVESRTDATGGVAAETVPAQITRVQNKLTGLAVNTPGGAYTRVRDYNPTIITDVQVILSTNRALFRRQTFEPGSDYYLVGSLNQQVNQTYTSAVGGENQIALKNVPAISIDTVLLNNVPITSFFLQSDSTFATGGSTIAQDYLVLGSNLIAGDVVLITMTYNAILSQVQTNVFGVSQLRKTNEIARQFRMVPLNITVTGKALPGYTPSQLQTSISTLLQSIVEPGIWQEEIDPATVLSQLKTGIQGLSSPQITLFQRSTGATGLIEPCIFEQNELAEYDPNDVTITISST